MGVWKRHHSTMGKWEINNRKSEVIAFVVNAGINVTANNFLYKSKKEVSFSKLFALFIRSSAGYISVIYFSNSGLSMMNISSRYREVTI